MMQGRAGNNRLKSKVDVHLVLADVRFGSKADMCSALAHVC